jgi:hypothetical protein
LKNLKNNKERPIYCRAIDLLGEYNHLIDTTHEIQVGNSHIRWHGAFPVNGGASYKVKLQRLQSEYELKIYTQYIDGDTKVALHKIKGN